MNTTFFINASFLNSSYLFDNYFKKLNLSYPFFILLDETLLPCFSFLYQKTYKNVFISVEDRQVSFFNSTFSNSIDTVFNDNDTLDLFYSTLKNKYSNAINNVSFVNHNLFFSIKDPLVYKEIIYFTENFLLDTNFTLESSNNLFFIKHSIKTDSFLYKIHNFFDSEKIFYFSLSNPNSFEFNYSCFSNLSFSKETIYSSNSSDLYNFFNFLSKRTHFFK